MDIDYKNIKTACAEPEASSMIETFRAIGYSIETAIADIIDNSISAGAKNIWIDYTWNGPDTLIGILDDGYGMDNEELIQGMRPGSINPLHDRDEFDLGRFGLGLKTASFSQCRKFCVASKKDGKENYWTWDLDYVNQTEEWKIIKYKPITELYNNHYASLKTGTLVLWWDLDRLTKDSLIDNESLKAEFFATMDKVKKHLSMVFHRYIDEGLKIWLKERLIESWDPFMIGSEGLQPKPEMLLENGKVKIKGFVLPHRSKLSPEKYEYGKGPDGSWTAYQGFYIYRKKRMLVPGSWFGFFKREVHYDLCRISVDLDLTNELDNEWQIDIKKSIARPPTKLKNQIISLAKEVRAQSVEVYRHRGKKIKRKLGTDLYSPVWQEKVRHGKRFYTINREHSIINNLLILARSENMTIYNNIMQTLKFIEETVPIPLITLSESEKKQPHGKPFEGKKHDSIIEIMKIMYQNLIKQGLSSKQAKARIINIEPFDFYPEYLEVIEND